MVKHGQTMMKTKQWRDLGRPEAALLGVQYRGNDSGEHRGRWLLRKARAGRWIFAGSGLKPGDAWCSGSIEIDQTSDASPRARRCSPRSRTSSGPASPQMTYYETARGAKVFAAGAFTLAGAIGRPDVKNVVENLWTRLAKP